MPKSVVFLFANFCVCVCVFFFFFLATVPYFLNEVSILKKHQKHVCKIEIYLS